MLWKKPAVVPIKEERQDFLDELARQAGENRQSVQALLENYAREKDRSRVEPPPAPPQINRRWSIVPKPAVESIQTTEAVNRRLDEISSRLELVEEGMSRVIETVGVMRKQAAAQRPSAEGERMSMLLDGLLQLVTNLQQAHRR